MLVITTSMSPSLSMSPVASPRATSSRENSTPGLCADVAKHALALVMEEQVVLPIGHRLSAQALDHVHRAVDDDQIEPAVVVVVEPVRAEPCHLRRWRGEACADACVLEVRRAVVHVHCVGLGGDVRDEQIFIAIVVGIAKRDAHAAFGPPAGIHRRP